MNSKDKEMQIIQPEAMRHFGISLSRQVRLSKENAQILIESLLQADLRGIHSHGIALLPWYIKGYKQKGFKPRPAIKVVKDAGAIAVMDGDKGLGQIASHAAMNLAIRKAGEYGIGAVTVRNSNHNGMAAFWSMMALKHDMIGFTTTNAAPMMAPWGGITPTYGSNPVSYAVPAGKELPFVLDMATSVVPIFKMWQAVLKNKPIPPDWALDKSGRPTTDPRVGLEGLLLPVGGPKGYGLALVNDILCGVLSGGRFGRNLDLWQPVALKPYGFCHFFMALDIAHFMDVKKFKRRMDTMVRMMKESELAPGHEKIYLPGEIEFETEQRRKREGIPYSKELIIELKRLATEFGISADL